MRKNFLCRTAFFNFLSSQVETAGVSISFGYILLAGRSLRVLLFFFFFFFVLYLYNFVCNKYSIHMFICMHKQHCVLIENVYLH